MGPVLVDCPTGEVGHGDDRAVIHPPAVATGVAGQVLGARAGPGTAVARRVGRPTTEGAVAGAKPAVRIAVGTVVVRNRLTTPVRRGWFPAAYQGGGDPAGDLTGRFLAQSLDEAAGAQRGVPPAAVSPDRLCAGPTVAVADNPPLDLIEGDGAGEVGEVGWLGAGPEIVRVGAEAVRFEPVEGVGDRGCGNGCRQVVAAYPRACRYGGSGRLVADVPVQLTVSGIPGLDDQVEKELVGEPAEPGEPGVEVGWRRGDATAVEDAPRIVGARGEGGGDQSVPALGGQVGAPLPG